MQHTHRHTHTKSMITILQPLSLCEFFNNTCRKQNRNNKKQGEFHIGYSSGLYSSWILISPKRLYRCLMGQLCAFNPLEVQSHQGSLILCNKESWLNFWLFEVDSFQALPCSLPLIPPQSGQGDKKRLGAPTFGSVRKFKPGNSWPAWGNSHPRPTF